MTTMEILLAIYDLEHDVKDVVFTGGEPTLQIDVELCRAFNEMGYRIHLETNGTVDIDEIKEYLHHVTVCPKNLEKMKLKSADDLKLLFPFISDSLNPKSFEKFRAKNRYLQLLDFGKNNPPNKLSDINKGMLISVMAKYPDWKFSVQLHKVIEVQ